jgi:hypothetical protein
MLTTVRNLSGIPACLRYNQICPPGSGSFSDGGGHFAELAGKE